jgi:DNA polymerase IV
MPARTILHVDMDAFFVSVELLRRPELRGRPVVVGGRGARGVVAAASYEARAYGVFSAMPSSQAVRLCPHAVFLPGDHATYSEVSRRVMEVFRSYTPLVEPLSLDEAFLDVTGVRRLHGDGATIAEAIRRRVRDDEGLECSVGVAPSKFLAKLASGSAKPKAAITGPVPGAGVLEIAEGHEVEFLHPLPVSALWGVGPATLERLHRLGVRSVGQLAALDESVVVAALGRASGRHLHRLANAVDDRPVTPDQPLKSVSHEETYATDLVDPLAIGRELVRQADAVAGRLRRAKLSGRTVSIKVRYHDFHTITRSQTLAEPVDTGPAIARTAKTLMSAVDLGGGVRLLGVAVTGLVADGARQLSFDDAGAWATAGSGWDLASRAVDDIRDRYGDGAIGPAAAAGPTGLRLVRRGAQQWGPDEPTS